MKAILKNQKNRIFSLSVIVMSVIFAGIFMQSCESNSFLSETDSSEHLSEIELITKSAEFENYIIAATGLQQALKTFEKEFAIVDFANLETVIENGKKVKYLPATIRSLNIDGKIILTNEKKEALLNKYPQLLTLNLPDFANYINNCVKQSIRVNEFFLDEKINIYQPSLKSVTSEYGFNNMSQLVGYLYNWTFMPNYVEVIVVIFSDGTSLAVLDSNNTANYSEINIRTLGNSHYYNGKRISEITHTHRGSYSPSSADLQAKNSNPYCSWSIFYNGAFYYY
ncbi:MAG: hypothetical protein LBP72_10205 [Dysgonamonadaceae bacterium]|jgi:hypothetical protein|nr:hypothetical protein [Dysgonamonadaceae bacterium]